MEKPNQKKPERKGPAERANEASAQEQATGALFRRKRAGQTEFRQLAGYTEQFLGFSPNTAGMAFPLENAR